MYKMRTLLIVILSLSCMSVAFGQTESSFANTTGPDTKEAAAIGEIGGSAGRNLKGGGSSVGPNLAVEVTPIEKWLELEAGTSPTFTRHATTWEFDFLIKKPWTLSPKAELMFGVGLAWNYTNEPGGITNATGGEAALDFMFWPFAKRRFGWYLEPAYEYDFGRGHEQSVGISGGLLVAIP